MKKGEKLSIWKFTLFQAFMFGIGGLICGVLYSFGGLISDLFEFGEWNRGTALAFGALIGMPLIGVGVGVCVGLLEALVYNLLAKKLKIWGIVFEF